jgi:hypothetical protein
MKTKRQKAANQPEAHTTWPRTQAPNSLVLGSGTGILHQTDCKRTKKTIENPISGFYQSIQSHTLCKTATEHPAAGTNREQRSLVQNAAANLVDSRPPLPLYLACELINY